MSRRPQNMHNNEGKRRFEELNSEIEYLKNELYMNDCIMRNELESHVFDELDRAFLAAEVYKNRLIALNKSSRSQLQLVQMAASAKNYYSNYYSYNGWDVKRLKYNTEDFTEDIDIRSSYNNQRQSQNSNKKKKRQIVPVDSKTIAVKTENSSIVKNITPLVTTGPVNAKNMALAKPNTFKTPAPLMSTKVKKSHKRTRPHKNNAIPAKRTATGPAIIMPSKTSYKDAIMVQNYLSKTPVKTEPKEKSKISDRLIIKTEDASNSEWNNKIKIEPNSDMMEDDLEHHI